MKVSQDSFLPADTRYCFLLGDLRDLGCQGRQGKDEAKRGDTSRIHPVRREVGRDLGAKGAEEGAEDGWLL